MGSIATSAVPAVSGSRSCTEPMKYFSTEARQGGAISVFDSSPGGRRNTSWSILIRFPLC